MLETDQKIWSYLFQSTMADPARCGKIALEDGRTSCTYEALFQNIQKYASVFSALGMTQKARARVGLLGTTAAETIFAIYGLNMTGADVSIINSLSALKADRIMQVVRDEHLTDLILTDDFLQEETLRKIVQAREELGLRFVLLMHPPMCGCAVPMPIAAAFEQKSTFTRAFWGPLYLDFLTGIYGSTPISYAENRSSDTAITIHTSGSTGGSGSPIVMSDRAFNCMSNMCSSIEGYEDLKKDPVTAVSVDLSNAYGIIVQVHFILALGGKLVLVPANLINPLYFKAIPRHKITVLFNTAMVIDMWMKYPDAACPDFSSVKLLILGGSSVSAADKERYRAFFMKHGSGDIHIVNGYGISELGGVCALSSEDIHDESVGKLLNGFDARFLDDETGTYLTAADAPCTGLLYLNSGSMATLEQCRGTVKYEMIDGKPFICTNDLMQMEADGKLTYLGRANRYFLHADGIKYQSGRVETEVSRQEGIESCGIVPVFKKTQHDSIPMLCVTTTGSGAEEPEIVRQALLKIFREEQILAQDQLPAQVLIAEALPRNGNGKLDLFQITNGKVSGDQYRVEPVLQDGRVIDIRLTAMTAEDENMMKQLFQGIAKDIFDESVPGQAINEVKEKSEAFFGMLPPAQMLPMMNMLYQTWYYTMAEWFNRFRRDGTAGSL